MFLQSSLPPPRLASYSIQACMAAKVLVFETSWSEIEIDYFVKMLLSGTLYIQAS